MRWARVWGGALILLLLVPGGLEYRLQQAGVKPEIIGDFGLWAVWRDRVYAAPEERVMVGLGSSRMQVGISTEVMASLRPQIRFVQLAAVASHPPAVLRDLAADPGFSGIVLCDLHENALTNRYFESQQGYVDFHHGKWNPDRHLHRLIRLFLEQHLSIMSFSANPLVYRNLYAIVTGRREAPRPVHELHADRWRPADFRRIPQRSLQHRLKLARTRFDTFGIDREEWDRNAARMRDWVEQIRARGGEVVFLRMPTSGDLLRNESALIPRRVYWDRLAKLTTAITIHFQDVAGLDDFVLPDASHLDIRDAGAFTRALLRELKRRGVIHR